MPCLLLSIWYDVFVFVYKNAILLIHWMSVMRVVQSRNGANSHVTASFICIFVFHILISVFVWGQMAIKTKFCLQNFKFHFICSRIMCCIFNILYHIVPEIATSANLNRCMKNRFYIWIDKCALIVELNQLIEMYISMISVSFCQLEENSRLHARTQIRYIRIIK